MSEANGVSREALEGAAHQIHGKYVDAVRRAESAEADLMAARGELCRLEHLVRVRNMEIAELKAALLGRE